MSVFEVIIISIVGTGSFMLCLYSLAMMAGIELEDDE